MSEHEEHHDQEPEIENPGGLDLGLLATVAATGAMLLLITVLATSAWVKTRNQRLLEDRSYNKLPYDVRIYHEEQTKKLGTLERNENGTVTVPVDEAMKIYVVQKKALTLKPEK